MRCPELREWMSLALDGRLPAEARCLLEAHIAVCPDCAWEWERWQEIGALFDGAPTLEPPAGLTERIMARIPARPRRGAPASRLAAVALGLAVLGDLAALAIVPSLAAACATVAASQVLPGALAVLLRLGLHLLRVVAALAEVGWALLWASVRSPVLGGMIIYIAVALAVLAAWVRVVLQPAPAAAG